MRDKNNWTVRILDKGSRDQTVGGDSGSMKFFLAWLEIITQFYKNESELHSSNVAASRDRRS